MANSPIQVVLNSKNFIETWERKGGGLNKDFYAGMDKEFIEHRSSIISQITNIQKQEFSKEYGEVAYAKVMLKQSAIAKSHRPTSALFRKDIAPIVGVGEVGEMYVELNPESVETLNKKILSTEINTNYKEGKDGKIRPAPSDARSEVGAIDQILPYTRNDRRKFTTQEAIQWLSDQRTGGAYFVELFDTPSAGTLKVNNYSQNKKMLFSSFFQGLSDFEYGIETFKLMNVESPNILAIRLSEGDLPANIQFGDFLTKPNLSKESYYYNLETDANRHAQLLEFLSTHPLVKKIILPPIISSSHPTRIPKKTSSSNVIFPDYNPNAKYPKIGVIDSGVSDCFGDWIIGRSGFLTEDDRIEDHGTFIAGLLISGKSINDNLDCYEPDGCQIYDLDIHAEQGSFLNYYNSIDEFFDELNTSVKSAKLETGVRIFNFSLNVDEHASSSDAYGICARGLDSIAEENDVIFVISAGNIKDGPFRTEWPEDPVKALSILAASRRDTLRNPAESFRNLSVAAVNPPNLKGIIPFAPAAYSCRGPKTRIGLKPDLAHVGGAGYPIPVFGSGLFSVTPTGEKIHDLGTSYAAPNVSKTLARIENLIEGDVSRESLMALAIHHANLPEILTDEKFNDVAKHLVGFGIPANAEEILRGNPYAITLIFTNIISANKRMSFNFTWPPSLVNAGKCSGFAKLTIVSSPPFDHTFGAEFVRINIKGELKQEQAGGTYKGRLKPKFLPEGLSAKMVEKGMIDHSFKWSPIKVYENEFKKGVGPRSNWRLDVEYLVRDGERFPTGGVPFTAILTIADNEQKKPIFTEMRQILQAQGASLIDVQSASVIRPRI